MSCKPIGKAFCLTAQGKLIAGMPLKLAPTVSKSRKRHG